MLFQSCALALAVGVVEAAIVQRQATTSVPNLPDYLVTYPELVPGPTQTGSAAFLAESNPAPFASTTYIPNTPLETQVPIVGNTNNGNIFQMFGQLSHYFPNPSGFGVDEYALPVNASIVQLQMLSRHGARYPTTGAGAQVVGQRITNYTSAGNTFTGPLSFLNKWTYKLGAEILVPVGRQELFDSGVLHQIEYGHLYNISNGKIIARSTTQDRMLKSAEYFLAGFFGLEWTHNATLVLAIENVTGVWNNTLAGYDDCPNSNLPVSVGGSNATKTWSNIYLADAVKRLNTYGPSFNWTITDAYNAQSLCAYETVALGYSNFCGLFTYQEWEGYEYSVDINFAGNNMFQSPTGRGVGIGYVEEILARLQSHVISQPTAQINVTLDSNSTIFPVGNQQNLYFDFSHDTNIASILTAFGLTQFATYLPADHIVANRSNIVSHMEPFGARLDMEIIQTPSPLDGNRANGTHYLPGNSTKYMHFIMNQRTIPLGASYPQCGQRQDGWCELNTFIQILTTKLAEAQYQYSCFGKYPANPYGSLSNGVPLPNAATAAAPSTSSVASTSSSKAASGSASASTATSHPASTTSAGGKASCPTNGALVCNGPTQFGLCNFGSVVWQPVAPGTGCQDGKIVGTGIYAVPSATAH